MNLDAKYLDITVKLSDGNVFAIIGRVRRALRNGGVSDQEIDQFTKEMMTSGDYDHALQTVMRWVNVNVDQEEEV